MTKKECCDDCKYRGEIYLSNAVYQTPTGCTNYHSPFYNHPISTVTAESFSCGSWFDEKQDVSQKGVK